MRIADGVKIRVRTSQIAKFSAKNIAEQKEERCTVMIRRCKTMFDKCQKCGHEFKKKEKVCPECKTLRKCNYKFNKNEMSCPVCKAERVRCSKKAEAGTDKCEQHHKRSGGAAIDIEQKDLDNYDPTATDKKSLAVGAIMDIDYELQKYQKMMSDLEKMVDKTDPKELAKYIFQVNKYWKDVLKTYYEIIDRKKVIEKIPADLDAQIKEIVRNVDEKSTVACIEAFISAMHKNNVNDTLINNIINSLPREMTTLYNNSKSTVINVSANG